MDDELMREIDEWQAKFNRLVDNGEESGGASLLEIEADRLLQRARDRLPQWVSVEERLPERSDAGLPRSRAVLGWTPENFCMYTLTYEHDKEIWCHFGASGLKCTKEVTHWMPLPPPPSGKDG